MPTSFLPRLPSSAIPRIFLAFFAICATFSGCKPVFNGTWSLAVDAYPADQPQPDQPYYGIMSFDDDGIDINGLGSLDVGEACLLPFTTTLLATDNASALGGDKTYDLTFIFSPWLCNGEYIYEEGYAPLPFEVTFDNDYDVLATQGEQAWYPFGQSSTEYTVTLKAQRSL